MTGHRASVVVLTHNEGQRLVDTVESLIATSPVGTEIVVVDDGSTDGSPDQAAAYDGVEVLRADQRLGISKGRNLGARHTSGDVIVFSDAHVQAQPGWLAPLLKALDSPDVSAVAPTVGHLDGRTGKGHGFTWSDMALHMKWLRAPDQLPVDVPFLCGCFIAMTRTTFDAVGGFDEGMYRWGLEDSELSLRLWLLGGRCQAVPAGEVLHLFRDAFPYPVEPAGVVHNVLRLAVLHFSDEGLQRIVAANAHRPSFAAAWTQLLDSDAWDRRAELDAVRQRDAAWFGERFAVDAVR